MHFIVLYQFVCHVNQAKCSKNYRNTSNINFVNRQCTHSKTSYNNLEEARNYHLGNRMFEESLMSEPIDSILITHVTICVSSIVS